MKKRLSVIGSVAAAFLLAGGAIGEEKGVDWATLQGAQVSLEKGLAAAAQKGKPLSGKFEMEEAKLQLSVYTASGGKFWEVIVDHANGKVSKTEQIKEGEDLTAAKAQREAMATAKKTLRAATEKAVSANAGYRAVSVVPEVEKGKPVAKVVLENSTGTKTVSENLD